jgi:hypothetical protein
VGLLSATSLEAIIVCLPGGELSDVAPLGDPVVERDSASFAYLWRLAVPDLLATAAHALPVVAGTGPVLAVHIQTALCEAACALGWGRDRWQRRQLTDAAGRHFVAFLVAAGLVGAGGGVTVTLRRWLVGQDLLMVRLAMAAASGHWRHEFGPAGGAVPVRSDPAADRDVASGRVSDRIRWRSPRATGLQQYVRGGTMVDR